MTARNIIDAGTKVPTVGQWKVLDRLVDALGEPEQPELRGFTKWYARARIARGFADPGDWALTKDAFDYMYRFLDDCISPPAKPRFWKRIFKRKKRSK